MSLPDLNDLSILETAACILFHVWNKCTPLSACLDALQADPILHDALKEAHVKRDYDGIRKWSKLKKGPEAAPPNGQLSTVLATLTPALTTLLTTQHPIPLWEPAKTLPKDTREHITNLSIPTLHSRPSLLLHSLQSPTSDTHKRLTHLFTPQIHTFLINTSGSGKTRLLLSGLCINWGIYLTSQIDSSKLGSADLQNALQVQVPSASGWCSTLPKATSPRHEDVLSRNRDIAEGAIKRVLLARLMVFKAYLEVIKEKGTEDSKAKHLWLLIQLQPSLLPIPIYDIFEHITRLLLPSSLANLTTQINTHLTSIRALLFPDPCSSTSTPPQIYIAVDEAQHASSLYPSAFTSTTPTPTSPTSSPTHAQRTPQQRAKRPILHPILHTLTLLGSTHGLTLLLSGTGLSQSALDTSISSAVLKPASYRFVSSTGAFSCPQAQSAYLESYFPKDYFQSVEGKRLQERCWYWLRGRYRFTAGYLSELIVRGFVSPHKVLSGYIGYICGVRITDAPSYTPEEGEDEEWSISKLDFDNLRHHTSMLQTIHTLTTHALLRPEDKLHLGEDEDKFVELGFASFSPPTEETSDPIPIPALALPSPSPSASFTSTSTSSSRRKRNATFCEPLVLLSAARWMSLTAHHRILSCDVGKHDPGIGKNGWESYLAFFLPLLFTTGKKGGKKLKLKEVFEFHSAEPSWAGEECEVVALYRPSAEESEVEVNPARMFHPIPTTSTYTLSSTARTPLETLTFLTHRSPAPLHFPHTAMGPDILFILRLSSGTHLWVALQAKFSTGSTQSRTIPRAVLKNAIRSTTPSEFYLTKEGSPFSPLSHPTLINETLSALSALPNPTPNAGKYSLLRVLVCFPAQAGMKRCAEAGMDSDEDGHALAVLNMERMKEVTRRLSPVEFLGRLERPGKRKRGEGEGKMGAPEGKRRK